MPEPTQGDFERWLLTRGITLSEYERIPWIRKDALRTEFEEEWDKNPGSFGETARAIASFTVEAGKLKSLVSAYSAIQDEFCWLFTRKAMEARAMDASRVSMIEFSVSPHNYTSEVDRIWVFGRVDELTKVARRFKTKEEVRIEVREDNNFFIGPFKAGSVVKEEDLPEWAKPLALTIRRDARLTVATADFRRIVKKAEEEKVRDYKVESAYENIGIKVSGREATILFFNEKVSRMNLKGYEPWIINIEGEGIGTYSLPLLSSLLILGLTETLDLEFQNKGILQLTYTGNDLWVKFWIAPKLDPETGDVLPRFLELLEKPEAVRKQLWILREDEVKLLEKTVRAIGNICRSEKFNVGMTGEDLWLYWKEYDKGYFRVSRTKFWEWYAPPERMSGTFNISSLASWLKDVEDLTCFLEGEPPQAIVLVGKGAKIAPKEARSEELVKEVEVPEVQGVEVFSGACSTLRDVVEDAETAKDIFLLFVSTPFEIEALGRDTVYYRAALPLDAFQTIEENYVPVNSNYFKGLKGFFTHFPSAYVTLGKEDTNIFLKAENALGSLKALIMQTANEVEDAVQAYKEEFLKPPPTPPPEVKPLVEVVPPPVPAKLTKEEFTKVFEDLLDEWLAFNVELLRPGLEGEIHYIAPDREREFVARFTSQTIRETNKEEIEKRKEETYGAYQEAYARKPEYGELYLKQLRDSQRRFTRDIADKTFRMLVEEAKKIPTPPIEYVEIRFLKDVPSIVGADMKVYGPFKEGDIAKLPKPNADIFVKQGMASYELIPPLKLGDIVTVEMQPGLWKVVKAPPGLIGLMRAGIAEVKRPPSMEVMKATKVSKKELPEKALENVKQFFGIEPQVKALIRAEERTFTEETFQDFVWHTGQLPLVVSAEPLPPPKLTPEESGRLGDRFLRKLEEAAVPYPSTYKSEFEKALDIYKTYEENLEIIDKLASDIIARVKRPPIAPPPPRIHVPSAKELALIRAAERAIKELQEL